MLSTGVGQVGPRLRQLWSLLFLEVKMLVVHGRQTWLCSLQRSGDQRVRQPDLWDSTKITRTGTFGFKVSVSKIPCTLQEPFPWWYVFTVFGRRQLFGWILLSPRTLWWTSCVCSYFRGYRPCKNPPNAAEPKTKARCRHSLFFPLSFSLFTFFTVRRGSRRGWVGSGCGSGMFWK